MQVRIDEAAIARLRGQPLPAGTKGVPLEYDGTVSVDQLAVAGWNLLRGDLPLPLLTLNGSALEHNVQTMAAYCRDRDVLLAPHGKTTMAPQIFARQIAAGCWALTAATPSHLALYRTFGISRIVYANELVEPTVLRWIARELARDPDFDFYCLVDSVSGVERMASVLESTTLCAPLQVLIEIGFPGGRAGCRTLDDVAAVAAAVERSSVLEIAGVEAFEGLLDGGEVDKFLDRVTSAVSLLALRSNAIVSAGGSAYFDHVVDAFQVLGLRAVLRSGVYVAHDGGWYDEQSPFGSRASLGSPRLQSALELWAVVLSRPEPGLIVLGAGKRDAGIDMGNPRPTRIWSEARGFEQFRAKTVSVLGVSDQHLHVRIDPTCVVDVGDLCACEISHPCTTFDKWSLIPVVDDQLTIIDAVRTFF